MELDSLEKDSSLLDLLLVVAVNIKLLIFGPIAIGVLALASSFALPQSFVSQAILTLPTPGPSPVQAAAFMVSPIVLDSVIASLNLSGRGPIDVARMELASQIKTTVGKDGLLRIDVTANTPLQAQTVANSVINTWLKSTVPGEQDRADLEKRLEYVKVTLESLNRLLERLGNEGSTNLNKPLTRGEAGTSIVALGELQARYFAEALTIPRLLQGLSRDVVKQSPTLPAKPLGPKKSLIAVLAALGAGLLLLVWVFIRRAWKNASKDPLVAEKQALLLVALGSKRPLL